MAAPFQYLWNTLEVGALEKVFFSNTQNTKTVNTLTPDDEDYLLNRDNFKQRIQMQLSQKQKTFPEFVVAFLKYILNFKHLPKKDDPHSWCISGNTGSEKRG